MTLLNMAPVAPQPPRDTTMQQEEAHWEGARRDEAQQEEAQPAPIADLTHKLQRLQRAQATLATAETKHGLRSVVTPLRTTTGPDAATNPRNATTTAASLDAVNAAVVNAEAVKADAAGPGMTSAEVSSAGNAHPTRLQRADRPALPIHPALGQLLPHGLARGAITTIQGSTYTALTLIAQTTANGGWAAIIGAPHINYIAAHDIGVALERVIVVPNPGEHTPDIIATLIDGVDLILLGPHISLTHAEQRTLSARNRDRGTHIISHQPWTGARSHITTTHNSWTGTHQGLGRLTTCTYTLTKTERHHTTRPCTLTSTNGQSHPALPTNTPHAVAGPAANNLASAASPNTLTTHDHTAHNLNRTEKTG